MKLISKTDTAHSRSLELVHMAEKSQDRVEPGLWAGGSSKVCLRKGRIQLQLQAVSQYAKKRGSCRFLLSFHPARRGHIGFL